MFCVGGEGLSETWLILACVDVEGRREIRLLIAVVAVEFRVRTRPSFILYSDL